jgi:PAS domain-containing protein
MEPNGFGSPRSSTTPSHQTFLVRGAQLRAAVVILRIWRSVLNPGTEPELLERLRAAIPLLQLDGAPSDFTYGFRHEAGSTIFLAVSAWETYDHILAATQGNLDGPLQVMNLADIVASHRVETFDRLPPITDRLDVMEGRVLGIVTATVLPQRESIAQSMIDRATQGALDSGALAAHVGRRVHDDRYSVAVVVVWPRRSTLTRYVRSQEVPTMGPSFTLNLSTWRFETYTALAPERLLVPQAGPAVLVVDDRGRIVDTTPGVEAVIGVPGEFFQGRSLLDLAPDEASRAEFTRRFLETGVSHGMIELLRPDGRRTTVRYRSMADVPAPGLRASVLTPPDQPEDLRPTVSIVHEALGASFEWATLADSNPSVA